MIKIGYFSKISRVTVKALRLYDQIGLLRPKQIDNFTGYRYYDTDQLPMIQKIISLKEIGFSLTEIIEITKNNQGFLERLMIKEKEVKSNLGKEKSKLEKIEKYIEGIKKEKNMDYPIVIKELPEVIVASRRLVIKDYNELFKVAPEMGEMMKAQNLKCAVPAYCFNVYHDGEYKEKDIDVEICEAVVAAGSETKDLKFKKLSKTKAACIYHKGPYEKLGLSYGKLIEWLKDNNYQPIDFFRESYIDGCWNKEDSNEWLTEIQVPIKEK